MEKTEIKQDYKPILYPKSKDLSKRWFIKTTVPCSRSYGYKYIKIYGNINGFDTVQERRKEAKKIMTLLKQNKYNWFEDTPGKITNTLLAVCNSLTLRDSSKRNYVNKINIYLFWLGNATPNETTGLKFLEYLRVKGKGSQTINSYRQVLKQLYSRAIKERLMNIKNPFELTSKIKHIPNGKMYFTEDQQRRLKNKLVNVPQLWLGVQLQYYCFIRNGPEMTNILIADIDLTPGKEKILMRGENSKNKKTEFLAIPYQLVPHLEFTKKYDGRLYLFSKDGYPGLEKLSVKWFYNHHNKIEKEIGLTSKLYSFYSWKHTGIYMFLRCGGNLKQLQIQLRHHSLDQVNQYMRKFGLEDCGDIKDKFPTL